MIYTCPTCVVAATAADSAAAKDAAASLAAAATTHIGHLSAAENLYIKHKFVKNVNMSI
jgi:hypothetical protein